MDPHTVGSQLRALRTAAGRTVASVAQDAGLSVPYIANLENGRGNPTITALGRLAAALDMRLSVTLTPLADGRQAWPGPTGSAEMPASLVRLGRTRRFRRAARTMADALEIDEQEFSVHLVSALAALAGALNRDLVEADWWRLLDALLLVATCPETS